MRRRETSVPAPAEPEDAARVEPRRACRIRAVVFDLDETLIDSPTALAARVASFLHAHLHLPEDTLSQGQATDDEETDGETSPPTGGGPVVRVAARLYALLARRVVLSPETRTVLEALRAAGLPFGIVSNGMPDKLHTIELLGLQRLTSCVFISGCFGQAKPGEAIFRAAAACLDIAPQDILFVGDKLRQDIAGPRAVGMATAWLRGRGLRVTRGPQADLTLTTLSELLPAVMETFPPKGSARVGG